LSKLDETVMVDYDPDGRILICRAKQLEQIPTVCHNCDGDDLLQIMEHVDGGSWICMTCNFLNSYEPSMKLTKTNLPVTMVNLGIDEIAYVDGWDFEN